MSKRIIKKKRKQINNYSNYINFRQIVNPYLLQENMNIIIIDLCKSNINQLIKSNKKINAHCQEVNIY